MRPILLLRVTFAALIATLSSGKARAQTIGIDDLGLNTGGASLAFFGTTPHTSLSIYSATALRERGICGGATLTDLAVLPFFGLGGTLSGTYSAPQALVQIGHVISAPPVGGWSANLVAPITVHGPSSGAYTFNWTANTFVPLPGFGSTGFVWDGVRDVGLIFSAPATPTGGFLARASNERRHLSNTFPAIPGVGVESAGAIKVRLTFTPGPPCATRSATGTGCYRGAWSFYESFQSLGGFDLPGSTTTAAVLRATPTTAGFTVASAPSAWFTPTSIALTANGSFGFGMTDDSFSVPLSLPFTFPFPGGSTNLIHAAANGFVLLGATTSTVADPTPTVAEMLSGQARLLPLWADLDPSPNVAGRGVFFDVDPSNQAVYVTWNDCLDGRNVPSSQQTSINVQCVLRSSGEFEFRYRGVTTDPTGIGGALVGWSQASAGGGNAVDPGSIDLSQATPFSTTGPDANPLALDSNAPAFGAAWRLTVQPITGLVPAALVFFGTGSQPGPDLGVIGAPGCRAYSTADITSISFPAIGGVATATATVPANTQLLGVTFTAQAGAFTFRNPLGLLTSNGMQFVVGH